VLRRAIADAECWPGLGVSVNVSPVQIRDRAFVGVVSAVLGESGFEPARLVLEVAEGR
jgi:EAL domain-containing protein (putative c-di-GMP-specific phosphodiesterase class I)